MSGIIEVSDLHKQFAIGLPPVSCTNFVGPAGEVLVRSGSCGWGKTTTLRCVAGLEHPTAVSISIAGKVVSAPSRGISVAPRHRDLGMVFQSYAVWPHMTVRQNVVYPLKHRGVARADAARQVDETLAL